MSSLITLHLIYLHIYVFKDKVSLWSPGYPRTSYADRRLKEIHLFLPQSAEIKVLTNMPGLPPYFLSQSFSLNLELTESQGRLAK